MSKRKTYTDEFKTMIAELVLSGQSVKDVANEYSLSETAVRIGPRSTYYDKQKEKPENKWKSLNKKLREDIMKNG